MFKLSIHTNLIFLSGNCFLFSLAVLIISLEKSVAIIIPTSGRKDSAFSPPPVPKSKSKEEIVECFFISL